MQIQSRSVLPYASLLHDFTSSISCIWWQVHAILYNSMAREHFRPTPKTFPSRCFHLSFLVLRHRRLLYLLGQCRKLLRYAVVAVRAPGLTVCARWDMDFRLGTIELVEFRGIMHELRYGMWIHACRVRCFTVFRHWRFQGGKTKLVINRWTKPQIADRTRLLRQTP